MTNKNTETLPALALSITEYEILGITIFEGACRTLGRNGKAVNKLRDAWQSWRDGLKGERGFSFELNEQDKPLLHMLNQPSPLWTGDVTELARALDVIIDEQTDKLAAGVKTGGAGEALSAMVEDIREAAKSNFLAHLAFEASWVLRDSKSSISPIDVLRRPALAQEFKLVNPAVAFGPKKGYWDHLFVGNAAEPPTLEAQYWLQDLWRPVIKNLVQIPAQPQKDKIHALESVMGWMYGPAEDDPAQVVPRLPPLPLNLALALTVSAIRSAPTAEKLDARQNLNALRQRAAEASMNGTGFFSLDTAGLPEKLTQHLGVMEREELQAQNKEGMV